MKISILAVVFILHAAIGVSFGQEVAINGDTPWLVTERDFEEPAIQEAIDATPSGGVLRIDAGQYIVGTLKLKSDFELRLMAGAELLGSTSIDDYPKAFFFGTLPSWGAYVRHARNIEFKNVSMDVRSADAREKIVLVDVEGFVQH